jgi:NADPH:quinone reductase
MRAMVLREHGAPDVLHFEDCPEPMLRDTDVLVEVHATSVNPVDTKVRSKASVGREYPLILGFDVSGTVVKCGPRVTQWKPGDEIYAAPNLFRAGANAELVALDARSAALKPAALDHATAATLPLVCQTAWEALHLRARIQPGQTVLIHAGAGGVGHIAVQLAKLHGCRVITTASRAESIAFCRDVLRADEIIDYRASDVVARTRELTDGRGVPVAFDTIGGDSFVQSLDCLAVNGHLVTILGGSTDLAGRGQALLYKNVTISYEFMGIPTAHEIEPERPGGILRTIAKLVDTGALKPEVRHRFPLEKLADAHRQSETGRTIGKIAVLVR